MKKTLAVLIFAAMLLSVLSFNIAAADNFGYTYDSEKKELTLTGSGNMPDFEDEKAVPWYQLRKEIKSVKISSDLTSIGDYAFFELESLESITLPSGIKSIGEHAFYDCNSLISVVIPNGVTEIKKYAFSHCSGIESVTLPDSLTSIETFAFVGCESLKDVDVPRSFPEIGDSAFASCTGLVSVALPDGMKSVPAAIFGNCENLQSITVPASVTFVGHNLFFECKNFKYIFFQGTEEQWKNVTVQLDNKEFLAAEVIYNTCIEHNFDKEGSIAVAPAHGVDGEKVYNCSGCNAKIVEKLAMTEPHKWKNPQITTEPTHTEYGVETYYCDCGATIENRVAKTKEHEWDESRVKREPTETEEGVIVYYCDCGERKSESIQKLSANTTSEVTTSEVTTAEAMTTANASSGGCQGSADIYLASLIPLAAGAAFFERKRRTSV